jgi:hypothetical protein
MLKLALQPEAAVLTTADAPARQPLDREEQHLASVRPPQLERTTISASLVSPRLRPHRPPVSSLRALALVASPSLSLCVISSLKSPCRTAECSERLRRRRRRASLEAALHPRGSCPSRARQQCGRRGAEPETTNSASSCSATLPANYQHRCLARYCVHQLKRASAALPLVVDGALAL